MYIELLDLVEEADEVSLVPKRRRSVDPSAASDPQPLLVKEESPSTIMEGVLGELAPQKEVVESESGAENEAVKTQSFAFDTGREDELDRGTNRASANGGRAGGGSSCRGEGGHCPRGVFSSKISPPIESVYQTPPMTKTSPSRLLGSTSDLS